MDAAFGLYLTGTHPPFVCSAALSISQLRPQEAFLGGGGERKAAIEYNVIIHV